MTHKEKIALARKLRSKKELQEHVPIFQSKNWTNRREAIHARIFGKKPAVKVVEKRKEPEKLNLWQKFKKLF